MSDYLFIYLFYYVAWCFGIKGISNVWISGDVVSITLITAAFIVWFTGQERALLRDPLHA